MKYLKIIGQPFCILLYIISAIFAFKKKPIWLALLFGSHLTEYFVIGKKVGKESNMSKLSAFLHCIAYGLTWWIPIKFLK